MTNQQLLHVLRSLKPYLKQAEFVCIAARVARKNGDISYAQEEQFVDFIRGRLEGHYTVIGWLESKGFCEAEQVRSEVKLAYRMRWVNAMIKEFSSPS